MKLKPRKTQLLKNLQIAKYLNKLLFGSPFLTHMNIFIDETE